ncbi:MAG: ATP-binding protein [Solirubrobacterales bacterium]
MKGLSFRHWPVRWRIAGVSAGLTLVILVAFALIVGRLVSNKLKDDFRDEVQADAAELAATTNLLPTSAGGLQLRTRPDLSEMYLGGEGVARITNDQGSVPVTLNAPPLGEPTEDVHRVGDYEVASAVMNSASIGGPVYLQYGRDASSLDETIGRLWLFLAGGVLGGTVLAGLGGVLVAGRAMSPISSLTAAAREITSTRDPSKRLPMPETEDEVAELAATLDQMLRGLDAARGETEQMIQAQREFVADASHELRTPLTSVLANLELLHARLAETGESSEELEMVEGALGSSRRMRRLVSDLLLLARADAGRSGPRRSCDLSEIAAGALAEVGPVARDHELTIAINGDPVPIDGNPDDLHRLVLNLLENAVSHTPDGTAVRLSVERRDGTAVLDVSDDGPGLPPELGEVIFSRFVRGSGPADTAIDSGTGLGLAIVKAVALSHGGDVVAGSSPAGGARFVVTLPLDEAALKRRRAAVG